VKHKDHASGDDPDGLGSSDLDSLIFHSKVYAMAEKYYVHGLKFLARDKFDKLIETDGSWLKPAELLAVAEHAYTSTHPLDRGIRNVVVRVMNAAFKDMDKQGELASAEVRERMLGMGTLCYDLWRYAVKEKI
jgi:hypothetical protein